MKRILIKNIVRNFNLNKSNLLKQQRYLFSKKKDKEILAKHLKEKF